MPPEQQTSARTPVDQLAYMRLMKGYRGQDSADYSNVTPEQEREYCKAVVEKVFQLCAIERSDNEDCYNACVDKCVSTGVLRAKVWEEWGGYPDLSQKMARIAALTNQTGVYHLLDAETVVAAIAVKMNRTLKINGNDNVTTLLLKYKVFGLAHVSAKAWHIGDTKIIRTNKPYGKSTPPPVEDTKVSGIRQLDPNSKSDDTAQTMPETRAPSPQLEVGGIPGPLLWSSRGPVEMLLGDLEHLANVGNMDDTTRQKLRVLTLQAGHLFRNMEFKRRE
ncbi:uncharacterized protein Triagg1_4823 [Trichoderma aggressivum f. europaeum]|uniref:Uncharacterized protein n=1 Tax=Trichoderma aggressivum f. europaeum TaxID=173218 RepID=A0AAE1IED7_9HYPO|nr:hypothetical protein Triagg1_4823 [Trichoderma aggressivum f. europaeum]